MQKQWKKLLTTEFKKPYFTKLTTQVKHEYLQGPVFPEPKNIFRAFDLTPVDQTKVVIIGQDPYHTPGVADGLSFSTQPGNKVPPSLRNIFKEIGDELYKGSYPESNNPDLTRWATQGVLLLNNTLTVRSGQANSHKTLGWGEFTDAVIQTLARERNNLVFMLWGKFAIGKQSLITTHQGENEHLILTSPHPSPFSADRGFFGNGHFFLANEYLQQHNLSKITW